MADIKMIGTVSRRWKHYVLFYRYVEDMVNKRTPFREAHLKLAKSYEGKGLLLGGALQNPIDGALLFWEGEEQTVKTFVDSDPYVKNKLVSSYEIREINIAGGSLKLNH
jgi:uncharacterized protein